MPVAAGKPARAKLIAALMSPNEGRIENALSFLEPIYGSVELRSSIFPFTYSDYYRAEMGEGLLKMFCSFAKLIEPGEIVGLKLAAIECEKSLTTPQRQISRTVNVDPGYVNVAKLVLATTKDCSHRIYICSGVYGDVELIYKCGSFNSLDWTYPDYRTSLAIDFFNKVRSAYLAQLKDAGRA